MKNIFLCLSLVLQVVYNGPLPPPPQHQPCLSFGEDGRYIGDTAELLSVFSKDEASPLSAAEQGRVQSTFGTSTPAVLFADRQTVQPDTSERNLSIVSTLSSRSVSTLPGVPGQSVQRPSIQVCPFYEIHVTDRVISPSICGTSENTKQEFKRKARVRICEHCVGHGTKLSDIPELKTLGIFGSGYCF